MNRPFTALILIASISGCANTNTAGTTVQPQATTGQIVLSETQPTINRTGGNAALNIGAAVLGAFIPGPWGGVASVAAGQAGGVALANSGNTTRYQVRMADGTMKTFSQADAPKLPAGTPVSIITMADGTQRVVQDTLNASTVPARYAPAQPYAPTSTVVPATTKVGVY